jgi:hypothetical protein
MGMYTNIIPFNPFEELALQELWLLKEFRASPDL